MLKEKFNKKKVEVDASATKAKEAIDEITIDRRTKQIEEIAMYRRIIADIREGPCFISSWRYLQK